MLMRGGDVRPDAGIDEGIIAPWPQVDRYPIVIGSRLNFEYISAAKRQAKFGYRLQWVDMLRELLERDPSAYGNLADRILTTAGGRVEVDSASARYDNSDAGREAREKAETVRRAAGLGPAPAPAGLSEDDALLADQIAQHVKLQLDAIPERPQALARLLWSLYYGVGVEEILWDRTPNEWRVRALHFIHPRRVAYPDMDRWHPHVWDQGLVVSAGSRWREYLTSGLFGIDVCKFPNKFIVHWPQLLGGYPTEDGLGMILAFYIAMKVMGVRGGGQYIERFGKPWVKAKYTTSHDNEPTRPRNATDEDIKAAQAAVQSLGVGGLAGATLPDSIDLELAGPGVKAQSSGLTHDKWIDFLDDQIARAIKTTSAMQNLQKNGARSALEEIGKGAKRVGYYDAAGVSATLTRDLALAIVRLNYPGKEHLVPTVLVHVDDKPGPEVMLERIGDAVKIGMPIDADKAAAATGLGSLLAAKDDPTARILYPVKAIDAIPPQKPTQESDETAEADAGTQEATATPKPELDETEEENAS